MTWELVSEYNVKPNGSSGFDKIPANYSYFDIIEGKAVIKLQTVFISNNESIQNRLAEPFNHIIFDFSKYKYNMVIYSYYNNYNGVYDNMENADSPKGSQVVVDFKQLSDLAGINIPTNIISSRPAYIKYHIILNREIKSKNVVNINNKIKNIVSAYTKVNGEIKKIEKSVSYVKTPFIIDHEISVPFAVPQLPFTYQKYDEVLTRFPTPTKEIFGRDASNTYNLTCVHVGTKGKPCIVINAGIHGTEWQGTQYSTGFVLDLLNNTFPDVIFRNHLITNYHLLFVPCLNPWGMDRVGSLYTQTQARRNANYIDLNRDFAEGVQIQPETKAFIELFRKYRPFACMDCHMFGEGYELSGGEYIILGNGHAEQNNVKDTIINTTQSKLGQGVHSWNPVNSPSSPLLRAFVARQSNPYNIKTLSYITEIERPAYPLYSSDGTSKYTNPEIYQIGYLLNYLFLKTSIMYLEHYRNVKKIETYF